LVLRSITCCVILFHIIVQAVFFNHKLPKLLIAVYVLLTSLARDLFPLDKSRMGDVSYNRIKDS